LHKFYTKTHLSPLGIVLENFPELLNLIYFQSVSTLCTKYFHPNNIGPLCFLPAMGNKEETPTCDGRASQLSAGRTLFMTLITRSRELKKLAAT